MARPKLNIDPKQVELLASCGAPVEEIAAKLRCDPKTIYNRFSRELYLGRESGKMNLRGKQYELAMKGNAKMLIWLGKQLLGQYDRFDFRNATDDDLHAEITRYMAGNQEAQGANGRRALTKNGDARLQGVPEGDESGPLER